MTRGRDRACRPEATAVTVTLIVLWAFAYGVVFKWNPACVMAGALLGFAIGGGK